MRSGGFLALFHCMEQRSTYMIIIAVLFCTAGYLGFKVSQQGTTIEVQTGEINAGEIERQSLELDSAKTALQLRHLADRELSDDGRDVCTAQ